MEEEENKPRKRSTKAETQRRVNEAIDFMFNQNATRREWVDYCEDNYDVIPRQADKYWAEAKKVVLEKYSKNRENVINNHYGRLFNLFKGAQKDGEREVARKILADMAKLLGLNEAEKKDVTSGGDKINININIDDD